MSFDDDYADEFDLSDEAENGDDLLACPSCGMMIYDDSEKCPYCKNWITPMAAHARTPAWVRLTGAVVVVAFLFGLVAALLLALF